MFEVGLKLGLAGERGAVIPESEQGGREKRAVCAAGGVTRRVPAALRCSLDVACGWRQEAAAELGERC